MDKKRVTELSIIANNVRKHAHTAVYSAASGHPGGSLSVADVLTLLYFEVMNVDPKNPKMEDRDRFVLSKGHTAPALYATLAEKGFFPKEELKSLRHIGAMLQGHPCISIPGVDMSSGSLGQGISVACGMALSGKLTSDTYKVYTILGDGEIEEGQVWEAAMFAAHYKLDNLVAVVDNNGLQIDGTNDQVMGLGNIVEKFKAFGFECFEVDGHNIEEIDKAIEAPVSGKPKFICCHTIKGKGVSYMENQAGWHGKAPNDEEFAIAMEELKKAGEALCQK